MLDSLKHRDITILLVEDDEIDQMAFGRFIKKNELPYDYIVADSVKSAKEKIENESFDIAVVDYLLKDGNGLEVVEAVKKVPVIFVTGQGDQTIAVEAMKAGVYDYLIKDSERNYLDLLPVTIENAISHRQAQQRLRQAEEEVEKLLWVVSQTDNSMVIASNDGKIEWINEGFERLTGFKSDEVLGTYGDMLLNGGLSGLNPKSRHFKKLQKTKSSVSYESKNYTEDGKDFWVLTTLTPILDDRGEIQKIVAIDSNITDRKKMEQDLIEAKQKAEKLAQAKEEFLANMSHEIRTPMNAILGMAELLDNTQLDDKQQKFLESIKFASDNLLALINDILDLSKLEAGKVEFEYVPFNLKKQLDQLLEMFRFKVEEKGLEMKLEYDENIPERIEGDPKRLDQVMINLLSNAVKFTRKGSISIESKLKENKNGELIVELSVRDTGIGIPEDKQEKIFDSFSQAQSDTTRKFGGTGLGLTIVKKLVEQQKGYLQLESEEGKGSRFSISLPFKKVEEKREGQKDEQSTEETGAGLKGKKALLVEDNELNQMVATEFLMKAGIEVDTAVNGLEAVEKASKNGYDFILMDIQMPEMDGYESAQTIRKNGTDIPIIAMTAHAMSGEREKCLKAGMNEYITKPIKSGKLLETVAAVL